MILYRNRTFSVCWLGMRFLKLVNNTWWLINNTSYILYLRSDFRFIIGFKIMSFWFQIIGQWTQIACSRCNQNNVSARKFRSLLEILFELWIGTPKLRFLNFAAPYIMDETWILPLLADFSHFNALTRELISTSIELIIINSWLWQ